MPLYFDFIAGCFGGAAGVLAGHPLDTVKVRLQTQLPGQYRGTVHCCVTLVRNEGLRSLFKGLSSPLTSQSFINAIVFGVYGAVLKQFDDSGRHGSLWAHYVAGCASGFAQSFISSPAELLKLKMQIQSASSPKLYRSPFDCMQKLVHQHGAKSLFRGTLATVARDTPAFGLYFVSYEFLARSLSKSGSVDSVSSLQLLLAGGSAGIVSWLFNYQSDVIKTKFQADSSYKSYWQVIEHTYKAHGAKGFFNGLNSTLLRAFPTNAATFFTVEWTYRGFLYIQAVRERNRFRRHHERLADAAIFQSAACGDKEIAMSRHITIDHFLVHEGDGSFLDPFAHDSLLL